MSSEAWGILLVMVFLALIAAIIIVVIWQVFANQRAKATLARDEAYRKLAEQVNEGQQQTREDLKELKERVANIERVLKEVE